MKEKKKLGRPFGRLPTTMPTKIVRIPEAIEPEVLALKNKYKKKFLKSIVCNN